ncbi:proline iminopeptidase-family hydrolase [Acidobacteriota bacterium]
MTAGEGFIDVTGGEVWYKIVGSGTATPILLLHGGPGVSSRSLEPLAKLSDERPVIFYDQLGSGKSDRPSDLSLWKAKRFVEELSLVREALQLKEVHLFGHSWGTMLAVDYMLTKPSGIKSLILASPCLSISRWIQDANKLRATLPIETQDILKKHEEAGTTDSEEYMAATMEYYSRYLCRLDPWPPILQEVFTSFNTEVYGTMWGPSEFHATGNLKDYDRTEELKEISVPVLFTAGRYDEATPETTAFYRSIIPGAKLKIFENSAHMTMFEETDLYVKAIREFLRDVEND